MPRKDRRRHAEYIREKYHTDPAYREKHKRMVQANKVRQRKLLADLVAKAKKVGCLICEETEPCCLSFHHRDEKKKKFNISGAVRIGFSVATLDEEIAKCVLVCENCHRKIHAGIIKI